jgi:hypothetical protein
VRAEFGADLASAARALVGQPAVPLVSLGVQFVLCANWTSEWSPSVLRDLAEAVSIAGLLFQLGWFGAERVFFQRRFEGKPVTVRHLLGLVMPFMGRFFALGAQCGLVMLAFWLPMLVLWWPPEGTPPLRIILSCGLVVVLMDFALTFVTPALAYTTRSVRHAWRVGSGMIGETCPRSALYVLFPPLALNILGFVDPVRVPVVRYALQVAVSLAGLLAKGAIAAFYLRERGSYGDDGAAYVDT